MKKEVYVLLIAAFVIISKSLPAQIITTIAGNGTPGYTGDGGAATAATLNSPYGLAVDALANLYIADELNNVIRKVTTSGTISTVAGTGTAGYSGDGMAATAARLHSPMFLTFDASGSLFFVDGFNNVIRKINTFGIITTVVGNGTFGYAGDGGQATVAEIGAPYGVAVDGSGNLYFADNNYNVIRKVTASGIINTYAGTGTAGFGGDGGPATAAMINYPTNVIADASGTIWIADHDNNRIRKVISTGTITTIAGNGTPGYFGDGGTATASMLHDPFFLGTDASGNIFISDYGNNRIREINTSGTITTVAGNGTMGDTGDGGPATAAEIAALGIAINSSGNIYFSDNTNTVIRKISNAATATAIVRHISDGLAVFPNPINENFTITISSTTDEQAQIALVNITGEKVKEMTVSTNTPVEISLDVPGGIYFLSATTAHEQWNKKVVKE